MRHLSDYERGIRYGDDSDGYTEEFSQGLREVEVEGQVQTDREGLKSQQDGMLKEVVKIVTKEREQ